MRIFAVVLAVCACAWIVIADVAHIKAAKAKLISSLATKGKHNKRGIFSDVPPYKLGHDIPRITHSVLKPLVVTYPPTAAVAAVKIPVPIHHVPRYPVSVGHKVPGLPHPHYALNFPHTKYLAKPDHHYHHHHHHVAPKPIVPVLPAAPVAHVAPVVPPPHAVLPLAHPVPAPPPVIHQGPIHPVPPPQPSPVEAPLPLNLRPLLPAAAVPIPTASFYQSAALPIGQHFPYIIRPGGAVQTSVFATYPRYPLINSYQAPIYPVSHGATGIQSVQQVLVQRPQVHPLQLVPQAVAHSGVVEHHTHQVGVEQAVLHQAQPAVHVHPNSLGIPQPGVHFHTGQDVLPQPGIQLHPSQEFIPQGFELHHGQEALRQPGLHLHPGQEAVPQPGFHVHAGQGGLPQPEYHIHPTQEAIPQPGFQLHTGQEALPQPGFQFHSTQLPQPLEPTQPSVQFDNNGWSPVPSQNDQSSAQDGHYPQQTHHFTQEQGSQVFEHHTDNQYHDFQHQLQHHIQQQIEQAQYEQSLNHHQQPAQEYGVPQHLGQEHGQPNDYSQQGQDIGQNGQDVYQNDYNLGHLGQDINQNDYNIGQIGQEYGLPHQGAEGRSSEESGQQYHNHIPLKLQPPIDRPLDHFQ
ncbi:Chromosome segregation ATPase protein [Danaus plexippus plexippus]|uniref:Chromosome segregation ATPase protein n=1 Tax=Danaus plexippus plexippus TaxID=278856 RepID=A0A212FJE6_DANPL|nr:Chromosome segregation ATPase protein [Danaus plexippus plexippus]